jgi:hypothetical protein
VELTYSIQNDKKMAGTPKQPIKMCRVSARRFSISNFAWGLLKASNLQAESKIIKKILEHQIYQSKPKISKKKLCFVP